MYNSSRNRYKTLLNQKNQHAFVFLTTFCTFVTTLTHIVDVCMLNSLFTHTHTLAH